MQAFKAATLLPVILNVICLAESYWNKNLKLVPLMLQFIMIRKELQLLFPEEGSDNFIMVRNVLKTLGITILVFIQIVLGTFTSLPYWFRRINPFIHILILYFCMIYGLTDFESLPKSMIGMFVILFSLINLYLNSAFKALLKVVEQSIAKELNSHRRISTMFNSLQEGIVIVQQDH